MYSIEQDHILLIPSVINQYQGNNFFMNMEFFLLYLYGTLT